MLLEALKAFRLEIIEALTPLEPYGPPLPPGRHWLWAYGQTSTEPHRHAWEHPVGAWWWREDGEEEWQLTPIGELHAASPKPPSWARWPGVLKTRVA